MVVPGGIKAPSTTSRLLQLPNLIRFFKFACVGCIIFNVVKLYEYEQTKTLENPILNSIAKDPSALHHLNIPRSSNNQTTSTSSKNTNPTDINDIPDNDILDLCFVTAEFSESSNVSDQLPILDPTMIRDPPRHFFFTNLLPTTTTVNNGWKTIVLSDLPYRRHITQSRWPKFMGWQHAQLSQQCQVIFYGDAYLLNPRNESAWQYMANIIYKNTKKQSNNNINNNENKNDATTKTVSLMQDKQIGNNNKPVKGPGVELRRNARMGKVSWEAANRTIEWLRQQPDYEPGMGLPVYKNALFGYDPKDPNFRAMAMDFWKEYSKETGSWRDQPYWAYFLFKHKLTPIRFPFEPPLGPQGRRGHDGHIYIQQQQQHKQQQQQQQQQQSSPSTG